MWQLLNTRCGLHVTQKTVIFAQIAIDRDGVNIRGMHRLRRRHYTNKGPHFCLHVDGYDKLKPFGIAIHGCIDGFSRKILWLNASHTNNNPRYVAQYFVAYLKQLKRVPRMIRSDAGNENVIIRDIQIALRSSRVDEVAGHRSFSVVGILTEFVHREKLRFKLDVMFFQPFLFDTTDYAFEIPCGHGVLDEIERVYTQPMLERGCSADFIGFVEEITDLNVDDFDAVASPDKAK
ncbi:Hypothetical predicted protein [Mytilus galloprovincialis]|uniref:Integrase core domain-containing protein n=1 Tax=Mytilus galloprovincialis TaxID=29158 RepID=A0A8B6DCV8_MYTGA|nr:Hypothetical predicted protein [Mytilus galloprovincialis]